MTEIILSDGEPFEVRTLGIFELDELTPADLGPFTYKLKTVTGQEFDAEFKPENFPEPPKKPEVPENEIEEGSAEYYDLLDWQLYQAATTHINKREEKLNQYYENVIDYILKNSVENPDRIVTLEDWKKVYEAALVPPLTMDLIVEVLNKTYKATFKDKPIMEALKETKKGSGSYNMIRLWENNLMLKMKLTEVEYASLPLKERARKVCALFLEDIMSYLELEDQRENSK